MVCISSIVIIAVLLMTDKREGLVKLIKVDIQLIYINFTFNGASWHNTSGKRVHRIIKRIRTVCKSSGLKFIRSKHEVIVDSRNALKSGADRLFGHFLGEGF